MSSLQEQLLKAGLVDESKLKQAEKEKNKRASQSRKKSGKKAAKKKKAAPSAAQQRQAERAERDRALNQQRQQASQQKAIDAQVRQLVQDNRVERGKGEIPFGFVYRNKVKKIYIGETEKNALTDGRLAIATFVLNNEGRRFELVPAKIAARIAERDPSAVIELKSGDEDSGGEDDAYADYKVPDDLTW